MLTASQPKQTDIMADYRVKLIVKTILDIAENTNDIEKTKKLLRELLYDAPGALTIANDPARKTIDELFEGYEDDYEPIKLDFDPQSGREQAGFRPALVVSNDTFNVKTNMAIVCPITNTGRNFPLHIKKAIETVMN